MQHLRPAEFYLPREGWLHGFTAQYVPNTLSARLQRAVIRHAWLGRKKQRTKASIVKQAHAVLHRYRRKMLDVSLTARFLQNEGVLRKMANCFPTFIVPVPGQRRVPCERKMFCPWCYSRWVRELWERFDSLLYPEDRKAPGVYNLLTWTVLKTGVADPSCLADWWEQNKHMMKVVPEPLAGHVAWLEISTEQPGYISLEFKGIGLTLSPLHSGGKILSPSRPDAARVFRKMLLYPRGMVKGPLDMIAGIWDITSGWRKSECYGLVRGNVKRSRKSGESNNNEEKAYQ